MTEPTTLAAKASYGASYNAHCLGYMGCKPYSQILRHDEKSLLPVDYLRSSSINALTDLTASRASLASDAGVNLACRERYAGGLGLEPPSRRTDSPLPRGGGLEHTKEESKEMFNTRQ